MVRPLLFDLLGVLFRMLLRDLLRRPTTITAGTDTRAFAYNDYFQLVTETYRIGSAGVIPAIPSGPDSPALNVYEAITTPHVVPRPNRALACRIQYPDQISRFSPVALPTTDRFSPSYAYDTCAKATQHLDTKAFTAATCNYDAIVVANGNITDYVDISPAGGGTNGSVVAHREYDPFGNTVVATGPMVNDINFWFSTKYLDQETGHYYYGSRFYAPESGRFLSRDQIAEKGGQNVYAFVCNTPVNGLDPCGEKILSMEIKGGTGESGWIETYWDNRWFRTLESPFNNIGQGSQLGWKYGSNNDPLDFSGGLNGTMKAIGVWKWEAKARYCPAPKGGSPQWNAWVENLLLARKDSSATTEIIKQEAEQVTDGPTASYASQDKPLTDPITGDLVTLAWDAPRIAGAIHSPMKWRYYLSGNWALRVSDAENSFITHFHISFAFNDDPVSPGVVGHFLITDPPHPINVSK